MNQRKDFFRGMTAEDMDRLIQEMVAWAEASSREIIAQAETMMQQRLGGMMAMPSSKVTPYRLLGLDPAASDEVVKMVYHHLARRLHPDAGGDTEAMARLNQAYEEIARQRGWKSALTAGLQSVTISAGGDKGLVRPYRELKWEIPMIIEIYQKCAWEW